MSSGTIQDQGLDKVLDQLRALEGVVCEELADDRISVAFSGDGPAREIILTVAACDYRTHKDQYAALRNTLTELGRSEGLSFVAPPLPKRPMTPQMRAAREKQRMEFDGWQVLWHAIRKAEKAIDVAYEIAQMRDYY